MSESTNKIKTRATLKSIKSLKRFQYLETALDNDDLLIEITGIHPDPFLMPELDYYLQYIVHTSTHRAQIMTSLRKLGKETKTLDYILYFGDK